MPKLQPFRVIQIGFGSLGRHIASSILKRENLELVSVIDANPDFIDKSLGELLQDDNDSTIRITERLLRKFVEFKRRQ